MSKISITNGNTEVEVASLTPEQAHQALEGGTPLMDDELREEAHAQLAPCSDRAFLELYCEMHIAKFGKAFVAG